MRTLYAFDPRRAAILLIGGDKTGNGRWYETQVPMADNLYDAHLDELMYLSTLRNLVQAMGGDLVVTAKFSDGEVKINNFSDLGPVSSPAATHRPAP